MSTREDYPAGVPCWVDTSQPDNLKERGRGDGEAVVTFGPPLQEPVSGDVPDDALRAVGEVDGVRGKPRARVMVPSSVWIPLAVWTNMSSTVAGGAAGVGFPFR
jgi:hypothetical protein